MAETIELNDALAISGRWRALALLSVAELLGMSLWFSASAVVPALRVEWSLSEGTASWLTIAVQLGFVAGTLLSALFNLPDYRVTDATKRRTFIPRQNPGFERLMNDPG